jgi:hypothetical protein
MDLGGNVKKKRLTILLSGIRYKLLFFPYLGLRAILCTNTISRRQQDENTTGISSPAMAIKYVIVNDMFPNNPQKNP